jgi:hypothetical protein
VQERLTERQALLDREVTVLAERLRGWSPSRWRAKGRADAAYALAARFAELLGAPAPLPQVGAHVLADQIAVTGHDLVLAEPGADVVGEALDALRRTRETLGL